MNKWEFTDIHSHIIFGVDDGSESLETSLKLIEMEYMDGIRNIIATPHFGVRNPDYDPKLADQNFKTLQEEVKKIHPDMNLYQGNELYLAPGFADGLADKMSKTLNGTNYVLVEFPDEIDFDGIYHQMRKLLVDGYVPIFAHVERYLSAYRNIKGLKEIKRQGVLVQVNSNVIATLPKKKHFLGHFDKFIKEILQEDMVDFVATDIHDLPGRKPMITDAMSTMIDIIGEEKTKKILIDNPKKLLNVLGV